MLHLHMEEIRVPCFSVPILWSLANMSASGSKPWISQLGVHLTFGLLVESRKRPRVPQSLNTKYQLHSWPKTVPRGGEKSWSLVLPAPGFSLLLAHYLGLAVPTLQAILSWRLPSQKALPWVRSTAHPSFRYGKGASSRGSDVSRDMECSPGRKSSEVRKRVGWGGTGSLKPFCHPLDHWGWCTKSLWSSPRETGSCEDRAQSSRES